MPEEGWKNVPVRNYLYVLLQKKARYYEEHREEISAKQARYREEHLRNYPLKRAQQAYLRAKYLREDGSWICFIGFETKTGDFEVHHVGNRFDHRAGMLRVALEHVREYVGDRSGKYEVQDFVVLSQVYLDVTEFLLLI